MNKKVQVVQLKTTGRLHRDANALVVSLHENSVEHRTTESDLTTTSACAEA